MYRLGNHICTDVNSYIRNYELAETREHISHHPVKWFCNYADNFGHVWRLCVREYIFKIQSNLLDESMYLEGNT